MRSESDERPFDELSVVEKIEHVHDLWDRIAASTDDALPTEAQRAELERRLRAHEENPGPTVSWEELERRLEDRLR